MLSLVNTLGGLSLAVEGPSKAEITCHDNKDGTCLVSYLPTTIGEYSIIIRFDDIHIEGSPFTAKIMPPGNLLFIMLYLLFVCNLCECKFWESVEQ